MNLPVTRTIINISAKAAGQSTWTAPFLFYKGSHVLALKYDLECEPASDFKKFSNY